MTGVSDDKFEPDGKLDRAQLAVIFHALDNDPHYFYEDYDDPEMALTLPYPDMETFKWYTDPVMWCVNHGIYAGYDDGTMRPFSAVTRAEAVTALRAFAKFKGCDTEVTEFDMTEYPDAAKVGAWAKDAFCWALTNGIICGKGCPDGSVILDPAGIITRAEITVMIKVFCKNIIDKEAAAMLNGKYVLVGGGGTGYGDDEPIYDKMVELTGKESPNVLYIGLAVKDPSGDVMWAKNYFGNGYGCSVDDLSENDLTDYEVTKAKIENADLVFVGGGDTLRLVRLLKQSGAHALLRKAAMRGCVMSGFSAGAICFCESGESSTVEGFVRIDGIGCLNLLYAPHSLTDPERYAEIPGELEKVPYMNSVCVDGAALVVANGQYCVMKFSRGNMTELGKWQNGEFTKEEMPTEWHPVSELLEQ